MMVLNQLQQCSPMDLGRSEPTSPVLSVLPKRFHEVQWLQRTPVVLDGPTPRVTPPSWSL